jgi:NAD(P)-dependent dehydrogenase (short-subunit alcohol dehydrogenase family)
MKKLEGKVAMVTGASRGIGKAISIGLAKEGANLVLAARTVDKLQETKATVVSHGVKAEVVPTDVTSEEQIMNLFAKTMDSFGRLDILVNNAGVFMLEPIETLSSEL